MFVKLRKSTDEEHAIVHRLTRTGLNGEALLELRQRFHDNFLQRLQDCPHGEIDFFQWTQNLVFDCAT